MTSLPHALGVLFEVVSLLGFSSAIIGAIVLLVMRGIRGKWHSVPAEVVDGEVRWLDHDGIMRSEEPLDDGEHDQLEIHYRQHVPNRHYLSRVAGDERSLLLIVIVLGGAAVGASIGSFVLLFF